MEDRMQLRSSRKACKLALPSPVELMPAPFRPSRPESGTGWGRFYEAQRRRPTTVCLATSIDS